MDELGRALGTLAREACAGVPAGTGAAVRRRARRRVAANVTGGLAACAVVVGLAVSGWLSLPLGGLGGPAGGAAAPDSRLGSAPNGAPPFLGLWAGRVETSVFLAQDITDAERASVEALIDRSDAVASYAFESKEEALAHFRESFAYNPDLLESLTAEHMPESFRIRLASPDRFGELSLLLCPEGDGQADAGDEPDLGQPDGGQPDGGQPDGGQPDGAGVDWGVAAEASGGRAAGCVAGVEAVLDMNRTLAWYLGGRSWTGRADAAVVLRTDATAAQRAEVERRLDASALVTELRYETPEEAVARLRQELTPQQFEVLGVGAAGMTGSFRVGLADPDDAGELRDNLCEAETGRCADGVFVVIDQRDVPSTPG